MPQGDLGQALQYGELLKDLGTPQAPKPGAEKEKQIHFQYHQEDLVSDIFGPSTMPKRSIYNSIGTGPKPDLNVGKLFVLDAPNAIMEVFPKIDLNHDEQLTKDEIARAGSNPEIQKDAVEREAVKLLSKHFDTWTQFSQVQPAPGNMADAGTVGDWISYSAGFSRMPTHNYISRNDIRSFGFMAQNYRSVANFYEADHPAPLGLASMTIVAGMGYGAIKGLAASEGAGVLTMAGNVARNTIAYGLLGGLAGLAIGGGIAYYSYRHYQKNGVQDLLKDMSGTDKLLHPKSHLFNEENWQ